MRTTFDLPDGLVKQAKIAAIQRGVTLRELVASGLRTALSQKQPAASQRLKLPAVKMPKGHKIPVLTNRQVAELFDAEDIAHLNDVYRGR